MATQSTHPLVVIVGPTASGKTALAIQLAKQFSGEIICADSRTIYKDMDIGTAKPTPDQRAEVPHHLLDVVNPDEPFTVADFKQLTDAAIADIASRGKLPILVGGSGLYIDSVIYNFSFRPINPMVRSKFANATVEELQAALRQQGIPLPENIQNKRYLLRSLEAGGAAPDKPALRPRTLILGLLADPEILKIRSNKRVAKMLNDGLISEVKQLSQRYGWEVPAMQAPAYKAFRGYIEGSQSLEQSRQDTIKSDLQLAKKQRTWFKRNNSIHWLSDPSKSVDLITTFLNTSS